MANSYTRFRAYQLKEKGASFSYTVDGNFTLIEGRYNQTNAPRIRREMNIAKCSRITKLHITSWDEDHCKPAELQNLLRDLKPSIVEMPGYAPDTECGRKSKSIINSYLKNSYAASVDFSPTYINGLENAERGKYTDVVFNPLSLSTKHNDNSTVKLFRKGRFAVLSLGDCESVDIAQRLEQSDLVCGETDVMLVAHHGADNGFTTGNLMDSIKPRIGVVCNDWANEYGHPAESVRQLFRYRNIPFFTTKQGDVLVVCDEDNVARAYNLTKDNRTIQNTVQFVPKMVIR